MCGLVGCLLTPRESKAHLKRIKDLFVANLLANEERGKEATGVVACALDGSFRYEKGAQPAHEFIESNKFKDFLSKAVTAETVILLGHTREPTKGTIKNNLNNHPIIVGNTVGVHNGVIPNDDEIFHYLQANPTSKRLGAVDSEAIMALFDRIEPVDHLPSYVAGLQEAVGMLTGSFTSLFFNVLAPGRLVCLRYENPISSYYDPVTKALFFSSRYLFLRKTFGRAVIGPSMAARTGFIYDVNHFARHDGQPIQEFLLE